MHLKCILVRLLYPSLQTSQKKIIIIVFIILRLSFYLMEFQDILSVKDSFQIHFHI